MENTLPNVTAMQGTSVISDFTCVSDFKCVHYDCNTPKVSNYYQKNPAKWKVYTYLKMIIILMNLFYMNLLNMYFKTKRAKGLYSFSLNAVWVALFNDL